VSNKLARMWKEGLWYFYGVCLEEMRKTTKESSVRIGSVQAEIRTVHLPNTSQKLDPTCSIVKRNAHGILVDVSTQKMKLIYPYCKRLHSWVMRKRIAIPKHVFPFSFVVRESVWFLIKSTCFNTEFSVVFVHTALLVRPHTGMRQDM
jgi:hypothetical protein